jgi:predicted nucleic acid-binding protein
LKTFLDSGVLLHAWRGANLSGPALQIMADDTRVFVTSQMVRLELLPKPRYEDRKKEAGFYESHFADCQNCEPLSEALGDDAERLAGRYGLAGPDALQIAAALRQNAVEFYTSEKPGKPMFRVREIKVISLYSLLN